MSPSRGDAHCLPHCDRNCDATSGADACYRSIVLNRQPPLWSQQRTPLPLGSWEVTMGVILFFQFALQFQLQIQEDNQQESRMQLAEDSEEDKKADNKRERSLEPKRQKHLQISRQHE